jgi:DNA-binding CsgD family transcriptional regulator
MEVAPPSPDQPPPLDGLAERVYEIDLVAPDAGRLVRCAPAVPPNEPDVSALVLGRCHELLWARATPCPNCPFFVAARSLDGDEAGAIRSGVISSTPSGSFVLVVGRWLDAHRVRVAQFSLGGELVIQLVTSRLDVLASRSSLSQREREVLQLLALGHSLGEIATALAISVRTAKYHQANILEKLGADSRLDFLRLLSDPR